jgi:hypothetical protein
MRDRRLLRVAGAFFRHSLRYFFSRGELTCGRKGRASDTNVSYLESRTGPTSSVCDDSAIPRVPWRQGAVKHLAKREIPRCSTVRSARPESASNLEEALTVSGQKSLRITFAALWPGTPVTPPPGCVDAPHW